MVYKFSLCHNQKGVRDSLWAARASARARVWMNWDAKSRGYWQPFSGEFAKEFSWEFCCFSPCRTARTPARQWAELALESRSARRLAAALARRLAWALAQLSARARPERGAVAPLRAWCKRCPQWQRNRPRPAPSVALARQLRWALAPQLRRALARRLARVRLGRCAVVSPAPSRRSGPLWRRGRPRQLPFFAAWKWEFSCGLAFATERTIVGQRRGKGQQIGRGGFLRVGRHFLQRGSGDFHVV